MPEPRRIALVSLHTSPLDAPGTGDAGGMNVVVVGLADALTAAGHDAEVLTRARSEAEVAATEARTAGGTRVRFLEAGPRASVAKGELPAHLGAFGERMRELTPFDLVHSHYWLSGAAALPVAQEWGVPHVQSLHTVAALKNAHLAPGDHPEPAERLAVERMLVHASELTLALSAAERAAVLDAYALPGERVRVLAPGVDTSLFQHAAATSAPRPTLLVLARVQPLKGIDLAVEALALLGPERPRLVIAGGTSPGHDEYAEALRRRVHELGLDDDVSFLPAQTRVQTAALLREAALLIVPSFSETFGLVALEAAASGTPVVTTGAGGLAESVPDGVSGVHVRSRRPEDWAEVMGGLLAQPGQLSALAATAARFGRARDWAEAAADLLGAVEQLESDPTAVFGERPVFLHAHPDDESISTGGTLAALVHAGRRPSILTGTRGERGEVVPGELHPLEGTPALAPHREGELARALDELGGVPQTFLGAYSDSGMEWGDDGFARAAADAPAGALSLAPLAEVVDAAVAGIERLAVGSPTSVVSYDGMGGYGHPDHVRMHETARLVALHYGVPFFAIVEPRVDGSGAADVAMPLLGEPLRRKTAAMAAHATQLTVAGDPPRFTLSGGQVHEVGVVERYRLVG
ncbi:glycosyltransferase [Herbiconiux sp. CPCC 205716]|uniref:D-inositol 3-phosphate glycosyltransferase n=1 Tax=Herbiconiux gentiana TaxID=2970912 RepID=A0ABT2GI14_9MICO|nr:glycosyltransferase [Herbiconiux gentiana]MCS5715865.1 glycosyltransferase [Herbiconiux gentiana]